MMRTSLALLTLLLSATAGCGDDAAGDDGADAAAPRPDAAATGDPDAAVNAPDAGVPDAGPSADAREVDPTGTHVQYVADFVDVPTTASEAAALGQNIDGDPADLVDNALGQILATLAGVGGADPQAAIDSFVAAGELLQLFDLQAKDLGTAANVGFSVFVGEDGDVPPNPADNFSGSETFVIKPGTPTDGLLVGDIVGGKIQAGPGTVPLQLVLGPDTTPVLVHLVGARVRADVTATNLTVGRLGGAITEEEVDSVLIPGIAVALNEIVAADCPGGVCPSGGPGETILGLFDANSDGTITADELRSDDLITSLLAPDLDLFDAGGNFNPRVDGVKDSLSFGVGFTAVGAVFDLP